MKIQARFQAYFSKILDCLTPKNKIWKNGLAFCNSRHKVHEIKDDDDEKSGATHTKGFFVNVIEINKGGWVSISTSTSIQKKASPFYNWK